MNWKKLFTNWALFFILFLLIIRLFGGGSSKNNSEFDTAQLGLKMSREDYSVGQEVILNLKNNTDTVISFASSCPNNPFEVYRLEAGEFKKMEAVAQVDCSKMPQLAIEPGGKVTESYSQWNYSLFGEPGRYKISVPFGNGMLRAPEFEVKPRGIFKTLWNELFYRPIYNA